MVKPLIHGCVIALVCLSFVVPTYGAEHTKAPLPAVKKQVAEEKAVLVDVREAAEWKKGHVAGAVLLPLSELQDGVTKQELAKLLPPDRIVYTHCAAGVRSQIAAEILEMHGYDVRPLKPGYKDLIAAGFEKAK